MTIRALFAAGTRVFPAANDVPAQSPYRAHPRVLQPGGQTPFMEHKTAETLLFVEQGVIEIMVGGAVFNLAKGQSARVAPGAVFAWRNVGDNDCRVFTATAEPTEHGAGAMTVTVEIAAA